MKQSISKPLLVTAAVIMGAGLLGHQAAQAQMSGLYVGAGVGQSKARDACDDLAGTGATSCDDKDTAWKLFVGYQFHPNFAVEGGYVDLGKFTASGPGGSAEIKAKTWQLAAVGIMPLQNNFSVFGKAGIHRWDDDLRAPGVSVSDNGTDFMFGFGGGYEFTKNLGMRLEWERFKNVGDNDTTGKSDADVISLGLRYRY